ncbi:hypothetical protein TA5114_03308 [Cognatishimia activa]|uniref:Uncharacterized protein n=1 Tax=Cognatishimia activa TaxID=1715691 RepID=A0A0N7MC82_9RHOB|nr:hypothetical protein TA5114_03308 [Cognatishimia activa]
MYPICELGVIVTRPSMGQAEQGEDTYTAMIEEWTEGNALTRWNVSAVQSRVYPGVARPMPDHVDYRFVNGWVDTGDLPCREALREEIKTRVVALEDVSYPEVYLAGDAGDVDYSDFCHVPEWRVRYAQVMVQNPHAQTVRLRVQTAGAVHVWCGDTLSHRFEPFTRNERQTSDFAIDLEAGEHLLTVRFEDLHERDTIFGFQLQLLAGSGLTARIDFSESEDVLQSALNVLEGLRTVDVFHDNQSVRLTSDHLSENAVFVSCLDMAGQGGALSKAQPECTIAVPAGCPVLRFGVALDGITLTRKIGMTVMPDPKWVGGKSFAARKTAFLERQACGDDIVVALLALANGEWDDAARDAFEAAVMRVEDRYDCADFRLMSLLWIWDRYRDKLDPALAARLQKAILGFRYWMDEPGNDVMWFWSENHVLCFHIAQHLAGQMMPNAVFVNSGKTGDEQNALGRARLIKWFDAIDDHGLAEWNSAAYYPINYRGLLALFTLTNDAELKARAKALLDQISTMVALHQCGGVAAGSQGRIYEKELLAGPMTELGAVASLMFGGWHVPGKDAAAVMLALSDYRPDPKLTQLAYPAEGKVLRAGYQQGLDGNARLKLFKTASTQLSSVEHHMPGTKGHQQHVVDLQFASNPLARMWVNHPGTLRHWAEDRPSFWAGSGRLPDVAQADGTVALLYELQKDDIPFTHLFLPQQQLDDVILENHWVFVRAGSGFAAVWSAGVLSLQIEGLYGEYELRQHGPICAWVLQVSDANTESFEDFSARLRAYAPALTQDSLIAGTLHLKRGQPRDTLPRLSTTPDIEFKTGPSKKWAALRDDTP